MSPFANMFPRPITAPSVKNRVDTPPNSTGGRPMMAGGDASWAIEYAALPYGGGSDLAIFGNI